MPLRAACKWWNEVLAMYFHNTILAKKSTFWMRDIGPYRAKFLCESLENLRENLRKIWWELDIVRWESIKVLAEYIEKFKLEKVYIQESVWYDEDREIKKLGKILASKGISLVVIWDHTLVHKDDLPEDISHLPQIYSQFRKMVEKNAEIEDPVWAPESIHWISGISTQMLSLKDFDYEDISIDKRRAIDFIWWEDAAWKRLNHYFWETESLSEYKKTRNGLIGADYSSKFSAYLAHGCISARSIYAQVKQYEKEIIKNSSTYWLIFELLWRDFFQFVFLQDRSRFFRGYDWEHIFMNPSKERKFENGKLEICESLLLTQICEN